LLNYQQEIVGDTFLARLVYKTVYSMSKRTGRPILAHNFVKC